MILKDIPIFTTDYGVASLMLKEIPYKQQAFICVRDSQPGHLQDLLDECVGFCRAAGAEQIFAAGHDDLQSYPLHTVIYEMSVPNLGMEAPEGCLWPVTEETVAQWRTIYNEKMKAVDNSATLSSFDEKKILESKGAYFIHKEGTLWGIGWIEDGEILAVASTVPGKGRAVMESLMSAAGADRFRLEVASSNERAIRLYEAMGFVKTSERNRWYRVR